MIEQHPTIRLLVADDHPMMLLGIRRALASEECIEIVGEASDGREAVAKAGSLSPDIVIMDVSLPLLNGLEAARIIRREHPCVKVIILSMYDDREYVSRFLDSGASAYVLKNNPPEELLRAIRAVHAGEAYFSPSIAQLILQKHQSASVKSADQLTEREREVLSRLARGLSSKQIAVELFISE